MFSIKQTINKKPARPCADILTKDKPHGCLPNHPKGEERVSDHSVFGACELSSKNNMHMLRK